VFERELFPDQILVAEERQLLLEPDTGQPSESSHLVTPPQAKDTWLTATVDFIRLGWKRAMKVVTAVVQFVEKLKHRLHTRRGEQRDECPWCSTAPESKVESLAFRAVMVAASQQAASIETKRRLDLEYQFANGIWYSTQRLEKEGEPELRDLDGVPFSDKVNIKKLLPIVHIQSPIFRAYLTYIHDRLLDHPGVEQTLRGIRETMMPMGGHVRAKIMAYRRACTKCRRRLKDRVRKEIGDYPQARTTVAPPFYHAMMDIATGFKGKPTKNAREYVPISALVIV
jgi:hypothetical protein